MMRRERIYMLLVSLMMWATCISTASATGQDVERIVWNGKEYEMLTCPLYDNPDMKNWHERMEKEWTSTALYRGYVGHWSIENGLLYLDYVVTCKEQKIYPKDIPELKKYCKGERAVATWFSDTLRVVSGDMVFYEQSGFNRHYEHEDFIVVKRGKIVSVNRSENKVLIKGMVNSEQEKEYVEDFKRLGAELHKRYPEMSGCIFVQIKYSAFDQNYMPTAVDIKFVKNEPSNQQMARELKEKLSKYVLSKGLIPLYLINGKPKQMQSWTFPFRVRSGRRNVESEK